MIPFLAGLLAVVTVIVAPGATVLSIAVATNRPSRPMDHRQSGRCAEGRLLAGRQPVVGFLGAGADALSRRHSNARRPSRLDRDIGHGIFGAGRRCGQGDQMLRAKAESAGNLQSTAEQVVTSRDEGGARVIYIAPANPERIYVPIYDSSAERLA